MDERRGSAHQRGYTKQWSRAAKAFLVEHPICADPFGNHGPRFVGAECVDHVVPHKGDMDLFWRTDNWQALCIGCNSKKAAVSEGGFGNGR